MNRRDFLKFGAAGTALVVGGCRTVDSSEREITKRKFAGLEVLPSVMPDVRVERSSLKGRHACKYIDDCIWFLRDIARTHPAHAFGHPFLAGLKRLHERYGYKVQLNLFYRTEFFYGMDEFTLAQVPADYKAEFQKNADWLKFGFHSLQEFPDYPWINASYADVKKLFGMIHGEVVRFAGEHSFALACVPHWCPMSKEGVRALKDCGIRVMECSVGPRYRFDGKQERLPYGHAFRLLQNRQPEVGFYWRESRNAAISASICSYNHISEEQSAKTALSLNYIYDRDTGMNFKHMFCDAPCLNLCTLETLKSDIEKVLDKECLIFSNHEQYFFKDYLAYQPEYADKIRLMCKMMRDNGYTFTLMQDLV